MGSINYHLPGLFLQHYVPTQILLFYVAFEGNTRNLLPYFLTNLLCELFRKFHFFGHMRSNDNDLHLKDYVSKFFQRLLWNLSFNSIFIVNRIFTSKNLDRYKFTYNALSVLLESCRFTSTCRISSIMRFIFVPKLFHWNIWLAKFMTLWISRLALLWSSFATLCKKLLSYANDRL